MRRRCSPPRGSCPDMAGLRLRHGSRRRRSGTLAWPRRLQHMLRNRLLWPAMIGVALAVGLGVQMGESAVGDINPIHFQGAALRPQGIDPDAQPPLTSPYAEAYGWEQGNQARLAEAGSYQDFNYMPQA